MDDPWDVKYVRQSGQYISFMKLNGIPLLPPVLSKECRKEMQYYKLLAKEVEKRISTLKPYVDSDESEDNTDAPEISDSDLNYGVPHKVLESGYLLGPDIIKDQLLESQETFSKNMTGESFSTTALVPDTENAASKQTVDLNLCFNQSIKTAETVTNKPPMPIELPERDYNCVKLKEVILDVEHGDVRDKTETKQESANVSFSGDKEEIISWSDDDLHAINTKSSSLSNLVIESEKEPVPAKLIRQRSYTLLKPSPQLLAHLEVQSLNTGVEMICISMSESLSSINSPSKKRRSWDLEAAKAKWSHMATELQKKTIVEPKKSNNRINRTITRTTPAKSPSIRARSLASERNKRISLTSKSTLKSEPAKSRANPIRNSLSNKTMVKDLIKSKAVNELTSPTSVKEATSPKTINHIRKSPPPRTTSPTSRLISESEDPATKVRELYEKIQKQQLLQMANLVEKQKKEQMLLQQVFEEQNNALYKQLKTICPKSPVEAKEAWGDKKNEAHAGPVSLSQLINHKSPKDRSMPSSYTNNPNNTHRETPSKDKEITGSIKSQNGNVQSPMHHSNASRTQTNSPKRSTPISRRLNYDTSMSSEREYEPMLTDRTNDTMADLNVTFPSDSEKSRSSESGGHIGKQNRRGQDVTVIQNAGRSSTDSAIRYMEQTIYKSINSPVSHGKSSVPYQPTPKERAAATKIVAYAKGYLVRRLMKTARVMTTVQTIKDALLCALQLHQDREGIRGADVDLHRRLIQQITAACYGLHDTFVSSTAAERCAMIAADRAKRSALANRPPFRHHKHLDMMSQSHSGAFPSRPHGHSVSAASLMTLSNYETRSIYKAGPARYGPSPRRRPWR